MPKKKAEERARADAKAGKSASTQAGEFVREEMRELKKGEGPARTPKQAIAIGLSEARRAGVDLPPPKKGQASDEAIHKAERDQEKGRKG